MGKAARRFGQFDPHKPGTTYGVLDELVGYAIRRAQLVITEKFDARFGPMGITTQRFSALVLISENPGLKQTDLADLMGIARSGALAIVAALDRQGLIERGTNASDRRAQALTLSHAGAALVPDLVREVRAHDAQVTADLSDAERRDLMHLAQRIGARVQRTSVHD